VQVGLPYGPFHGTLATAEDYLRAAFHFTAMGGDCFYCAASLDIQKTLCDNHVPIVAHVGLIPSTITWTGWRAVGKTATEARAVWDHVKRLEAIGCFGAELEVVPDRLGAFISRNTPMIMLGMGAGPGADAQYLFAEDVLGCTDGHKPAPRQDLPQLCRRIRPPAGRTHRRVQGVHRRRPHRRLPATAAQRRHAGRRVQRLPGRHRPLTQGKTTC
jgi:ketopantoate hydroxymethyltransferase